LLPSVPSRHCSSPARPLPTAKPCSLCKARAGIQGKYLDQIDELYDDFHVIKLPLREREVRGAEAIIEFSKLLRQELIVPKVDRS
jgi:arsenite-transporting ATPase